MRFGDEIYLVPTLSAVSGDELADVWVTLYESNVKVVALHELCCQIELSSSFFCIIQSLV